MFGLIKFKFTLSTEVMLLTFSLMPLAEQSHLPCADAMAHSTATQAQQQTICAGKELHNKIQNNSFLPDCISGLAHQAVRGRDGNASWWRGVPNGTSPQSRNMCRLV